MRHAAILEQMDQAGWRWWQTHFAAVAAHQAGEDVIVLSVGEIGLPPPVDMQRHATERLLAGRHAYAASRGEIGVRTAIARKYSNRTGRTITPDHVLFAAGAQPCLALLVQALADPGDGILIPEPRYITYSGMTIASRVREVPIPLAPEHGFHLRAEDLAAAADRGCRILLLNSPHNPTGATLSAPEIAAIGEVAREKDLWILSDEVYEDYTFGRPFASPFDLETLAERTIAVGSISKSHAVPGWRCGWAVGPPATMARAAPLLEAVLFGCPPFLQDATAEALRQDYPECAHIRTTLAARAHTLAARLDRLPGICATPPEGGIFLFANIRDTGLDGATFAARLYAEERVSVMPGEAFGTGGAGHVRICMAAGEAETGEGIRRIERFARGLV